MWGWGYKSGEKYEEASSITTSTPTVGLARKHLPTTIVLGPLQRQPCSRQQTSSNNGGDEDIMQLIASLEPQHSP
ncbi:hypothetical protein CR513_42785, partial [Mucuna pruriens]